MSSTTTRRRALFAGVAVVAAAGGVAGALWRERSAASAAPGTAGDAMMDAAFWAQRFDRPEGGELNFQGLRGKPLLLNFWATWCPPCVEELPMIDRFFRDQATNGWQVVGLAIDQPSAVRKFLERTPVTFPNGLAGLQGTELVKQLGNSNGGLPFTLVLDAGGKVMARKMGQLEAADLEGWRRAQVHG
ncbi:MAG: redoxin domain-containing protein [Variovorax sp.]|nr:MAG: redoxin domain-containing protein [Variovorax sp.]